MFDIRELIKQNKDVKHFENVHSSYKPVDPKSLEEFFNLTKKLGVLTAIQTKNTIYVRIHCAGSYVPPEIYVLSRKFDLEITFASLDVNWNMHFANAKRHAIKIYE